MKKFVAILSLITFLSSCVTTPARQQKVDDDTYYRHDLCVTYETGKEVQTKLKSFWQLFKKRKYRKYKYEKETVTFCGYGVLPDMETYHLTVKSHSSINLFTMRSCHEEATSENPNKGIFKKKDVYHFEYSPTIERGKTCPLFLGAYSKRDKFGTAFIAFENPRFQLPATLECNGNTTFHGGVSVCQSRKGLIQKITFNEPVELGKPVNGPYVRPDGMGDCPALELSADKKSVKIFKMPPRECVYFFGGTVSGNIHKLYTLGYEGILLRE